MSTGLFGKKESFAPIAGSSSDGDDLVLAVTKDQVKDAPNIDSDGHTTDEENAALYAYYSESFPAGYGQVAYTDSNTDGHDKSGPNTDDAMTRLRGAVAGGHRAGRVGSRPAA